MIDPSLALYAELDILDQSAGFPPYWLTSRLMSSIALVVPLPAKAAPASPNCASTARLFSSLKRLEALRASPSSPNSPSGAANRRVRFFAMLFASFPVTCPREKLGFSVTSSLPAAHAILQASQDSLGAFRSRRPTLAWIV